MSPNGEENGKSLIKYLRKNKTIDRKHIRQVNGYINTIVSTYTYSKNKDGSENLLGWGSGID